MPARLRSRWLIAGPLSLASPQGKSDGGSRTPEATAAFPGTATSEVPGLEGEEMAHMEEHDSGLASHRGHEWPRCLCVPGPLCGGVGGGAREESLPGIIMKK